MKYISAPQAAKYLGISRIAVFKRIKNGSLKATKVGRNYIIEINEVEGLKKERELTHKQAEEIKQAVKKIREEYGETLKKLGRS